MNKTKETLKTTVPFLSAVASVVMVFAASLSFSGTSLAAGSNHNILSELHDLALKCAIQPYNYVNGKKVYGRLKSICAEVKVSGEVARFEIGKHTYQVVLEDSALSDGGDLNNISITNEKGGLVAHRSNIAAFGDVLLAITGSKEKFVETLDTTVTF